MIFAVGHCSNIDVGMVILAIQMCTTLPLSNEVMQMPSRQPLIDLGQKVIKTDKSFLPLPQLALT